MYQKITIIVLLIASVVIGQELMFSSLNREEQNLHKTIASMNPATGVSIVQGEKNAYWDYQSWGSDDRHLWVTPEGHVHAVYYGCTGSKGEQDQRNSFYVFSPDWGMTLNKPVCVEDIDAEFPAMDVLPDGRAVISSHNGRGHPFEMFINVDSTAGAGNFSRYKAPIVPSNYGNTLVAALSDSLVVLSGASVAGNEHVMNIFNVNTKTFLHEENQIIFPGIKRQGTITIASDKKGRAALLLLKFHGYPLANDESANNIWIQETRDGGLTWAEPEKLTRHSNNPDPVQTILGSNGLSAVYLHGELHVVYLVMIVDENDLTQVDTQLLHWCASVNNGKPTVAVRWDSLHFGQLANFPPFWEPHLGIDENGILTMVFAGLSTDPKDVESSTGLPFPDVFAVSSKDNGATWGEPKNLTNSPEIEETTPYISAWNQDGKINVLYQTDTVPGPYPYGGDRFLGEIDHIFLQTDHPSTKPYMPLTRVNGPDAQLPAEFNLRQNYPNPFNLSTIIEFSSSEKAMVSLSIYDLLGRKVKTLVEGEQSAGVHTILWHGDDDLGYVLPAGVYFAEFIAGEVRQSIKLILMK